ncbi:Major capsid protein of His2 family of spindle-shaped halovirus [Methanonatronarchaeum thermophilum]|uniref:Major capsid protein of His2 family of spindle-shaped halovirus n=1 Tax=Methanonatronarchaeum thermophilum TaxID=1927129 RepID=A0A1Y3GCC8_9EURY|nr:hypothetical protein [Methanonatronarchaeum thermophilum]OUJ18907.1 Major capsid protein of His2 family of spindle-shaped halovirus [Methanonatronarchaeum thermophilum]
MHRLLISLLLILFIVLSAGSVYCADTGDSVSGSVERESNFLSDFFRVITGTTVHEKYDTTYFGAGYTWIMDLFGVGDDRDDAALNSALIYDHAMHLSKDDSFIQKTFLNEVGNTETFVWSLVKSEVLKELNNGSGEVVAVGVVDEAVDDYYSSVQYNMIQQLNSQVLTVQHLLEVGEDIDTEFEYPFYAEWDYRYSSWQDGSTQTDTRDLDLDLDSFYTRDFTLYNGSVVEVLDYSEKSVGSVPNNHGSKVFYVFPYPDNSEGVICGGAAESRDSNLLINNPSGDSGVVLDLDMWEELWDNLDETRNRMLDNSETYVQEVYTEYETGDIDLGELVDPYVLAQHMNTLHNQTGYYGFAGAELALLGISTSIHDRFIIQIQESNNLPNNSTWECMLFTDAEIANNTLKTGMIINTTEYNSPFYIASGQGIFHLQDTTFEIQEIISFDGEQLDTVELYKPVYHTMNISEFEEELLQIQEMYEVIGSWEAGSGTPDRDGVTVDDLTGWLNKDLLGIPYWLIILGVGVFVWLRQSDSSDIVVRRE